MSFDAEAALKTLKELQAKIQEESRSVFKATVAEFFNEFPEVNKIVWTQYTPYFNDGESCEFTVGEAYFVKDDIVCDGPYDYEEHSFSGYADSPEYKPSAELKKGMDQFSTILNAIEDFLHATFDDHVVVTVSRDDISTESYDHD